MHRGSKAANRVEKISLRRRLIEACFDTGESLPCLRGKLFELCKSGFHRISTKRDPPARKRRTTEKHDNVQHTVIIAKLSKLKGCHRV